MSKHSARRHHLGLGIGYMLAATVFLAAADSLGKWLTTGYPIVQVAWIRSLFGMALIGGFALATGRGAQLFTARPGWHLFRSVLSTYMILCIFYGLKHITLAEFTALVFSAPFMIALISPRFLGEHVPAQAWLAIAIGFAGVLLIARPVPGHFHLAHLTTLTLAASVAVISASGRILSTTETALALNFYLYPFNVLASAYWALGAWVPPSGRDWLLFAALGITATAAVGVFIQALRHARPAAIAPFDYVRLIWICLLGYFIWAEIPPPLTWAGIALIAVSGIYLVSHGSTLPELGTEAAED